MKEIYLAETASKVKHPLLEKDVQKQCVDWARARGYWARKFSSQSQRSVPDYEFARIVWGSLHFARIKFACEFKAPGKTSTSAQIDEQEAMRLAGWFVFECDDFSRFKETVLAYEAEQV
jgi:hypothetical protein